MKRLISLFLALVLIVSAASPIYAAETEEWYGTITVEFSDSYGQTENLEVMVKDGHVYTDIINLSSRLGYSCVQNGDLVSVVGDTSLFADGSPALAVHFQIGDNKVAYNPLCGIEQEYTTPAPCIQDNRGTWVSLTHTLYLLGASCNIFDDDILDVSKDVLSIQMPRNNVLSIAASIICNDSSLSFDWEDDFGYSETVTNITDGASRIVTLFNGLLEFDGSAWLSLVYWDAFDLKFGKMMTQMLCTYSAEEMHKSIDEVSLMLEPFNSDGTFGQLLRNKQMRIDSDLSYWNSACTDYLEKLEAGCGSPAEYNYLYHQYEKAMDAEKLFSVSGENLTYIQDELSTATNFLDIATKIGSAVSYTTEFQNKDAFLSSALKEYMNTRMSTEQMSDAMAFSINTYLKTIDWGSTGYTATWFILEQLPEFVIDKSAIDVLLGAPANIALFAWDVMSETIPFYKDGLVAVENREVSNYSQKLQNDALLNLKSLLSSMQASSKPISQSQCMQLAEYCYVYLKACYLSRETAIKSLDGTSEEFQKKIENKLNVESDINQKISGYLAFLSSATVNNKCYSLGFLNENNIAFLNKCTDNTLIAIVKENESTNSKLISQVIEYDQSGNWDTSYHFEYNDDRLAVVTVNSASFDGEYMYSYSYNSSGQLEQINTPNEMFSYTEYTYNSAGKIIEADRTMGKSIYEYDDSGRLIGSKEEFSMYTYVSEYKYNENNLLLEKKEYHYLTDSSFAESDLVDTVTYTYDYNENGLLILESYDTEYNHHTTFYDYSLKPFVVESLCSEDLNSSSLSLPIQEEWGKFSIYLDSPNSTKGLENIEYSLSDDGYVEELSWFNPTTSQKTYLEFCYNNEDPTGIDLPESDNSSGNINEHYKDVLNRHPLSFTHYYTLKGETQTYEIETEYILYDINKDQSPELIVREDASNYFIYTVSNDEVVLCGEFLWSYADCLYSDDQAGLIIHDGGHGSLHMEYVSRYILEGNSLNSSGSIYSTEEYTYEEIQNHLAEYKRLNEFLPITDFSLLE